MRWPPPENWPLSAHSRQVLHRPHRWHVQESGSGPVLLLIHGAGGATQSWRHLFPILAQDYRVIAMDLPGQGLTQSGAQRRYGLDPMAEDILALCRAEGWQPEAIIGHSAGAAIALQMVRLGARPPSGVIGINAALGHFKGVAGWLFPMLAKALAVTPFSASVFAATTTARSVHNLIKGTGSVLDDAGEALYRQLASDSGHVDATLSMMAQWELDDLLAALPHITCPVHLLVADQDKAVPPQTSVDAAAKLPQSTITWLEGLGHLAHEEDAPRVAQKINTVLTNTAKAR